MNVSKFAGTPPRVWKFWNWFCRRFVSILVTSVIVLILVSCAFNDGATSFQNIVTPIPEENDIITVHYNERPPYLETTATGVIGLTGSPATIAFEKANLPFRWKQTPSNRQMYILQQNSGRDCLVGWFKNFEREKFAKYTLPIYQDVPQIALTRVDDAKIKSVSTVEEVFSNPDLTLWSKTAILTEILSMKDLRNITPIQL